MALDESINHHTIIDEWANHATALKKENKELLIKWAKNKSDNFFNTQLQAHEEAFDKIDCLQCANCCKTSPPLITKSDANRIAKHLKISTKQFVQKYTIEDINGEISFSTVPCVFLQKDNRCGIYEVRPEACRRFPHTDESEYLKRVSLNINNTFVCPAAYYIIRILADSTEKL